VTENLPVSWQEQLAREANEQARQELPDVGSISFKAGMMSYEGTEIPGSSLNVVVLATAFENKYYPEEYDADNPQPPLCWTFSESGVDMAPNPELVTAAQGPKCSECPHGEWGSDPKGRGGKACKSVRRMIVIPADELENIPGAHFALATISTSNQKHWSAYVNTVAASMKRPTWAVITKLWCKPDQKTLIRVGFDLAAPIGDSYLDALNEKRTKALEILMRPYEKRREGEEPKNKKAKKY
jgi:hypothetical protein